MWDATCHLCDHILPDTAMRQWVLTAPYEVRRVMALRPDALTACHRLFMTEIARFQKASSALAGAETGSVTFVQPFPLGTRLVRALPCRLSGWRLHARRFGRRELPPRPRAIA